MNPSRVDFVTLRLFCAVARTGSISKAAHACDIATSAASRRLSDFEISAGATLFERSPHGATLTAAGHLAMQHAVRLFQGFERFSSEMSDYSQGGIGHVRLWANVSSLTDFMPEMLGKFMLAHPGVRVDVEEQLSVDVVRAVIDGLADVGVFSENAPSHGLEVWPLKVNRLVLVCPRTHALARRSRVSIDECLQYDFVGANSGSALLDVLSNAAKESGVPLRLLIQVRSLNAMCRMIASGLGIGIVPLTACEAELGFLKLRAVPLTDPWASRQLIAGVRSRAKLNGPSQVLLNYLLDWSGKHGGLTAKAARGK